MRVRDEEVSIAIIQEIEREGEAQGREGGDDGGGGDVSVFDGVGVDGAGLVPLAIVAKRAVEEGLNIISAPMTSGPTSGLGVVCQ